MKHSKLCIMNCELCIDLTLLRNLNRFSGVIYRLGKDFIRNFVAKFKISFPY